METQTQNTLKVKLTVSENILKEIEKEIQLPYYSKIETHFYKVMGEGEFDTIQVRVNKYSKGTWALIDNYSNFNNAMKAEQCTEVEFEEVYQLAKSII